MTEQTGLKSTGDEAKAAEVAREKRRRLLKLGVSAAPIVLTLPSRSVLACHCRSVSAGGSLTHASPGVVRDEPSDGYSFTAYSYQNWMNSQSKCAGWNSISTINKNTMFGTLFPGGSTTTKISQLTNQFQQDLVTAYLNILSNPNVSLNCLTTTQLQQMASGSYTSPSGDRLTSQSAIQKYLSQNWLLGDIYGQVIR